MSETATAGRSPETSVGKGLAVLDALSRSRAPLGVSDIASHTGMAKSTVHRLLNAMIGHGYVAKRGERYLLSERLFEVGSRVQLGPAVGLREFAAPYVADLFAATGQTVHLGVLSGTDILYVDKICGLRGPRMRTHIGGRRPAYATGLGKALIAFAPKAEIMRNLQVKLRRFTAYTLADPQRIHQALARVREYGIATDNEESFLGVACLAVPLWLPEGQRPIAAISLSCSAAGKSVDKYRDVLTDTARQLTDGLAAAARWS